MTPTKYIIETRTKDEVVQSRYDHLADAMDDLIQFQTTIQSQKRNVTTTVTLFCVLETLEIPAHV